MFLTVLPPEAFVFLGFYSKNKYYFGEETYNLQWYNGTLVNGPMVQS